MTLNQSPIRHAQQPQATHVRRSTLRLSFASRQDPIIIPEEDEEEDPDEVLEWMSDREKAQRIRNSTWKPASSDALRDASSSSSFSSPTNTSHQPSSRPEPSPQEDRRPINTQAESPSTSEGPRRKRLTYTSEEEELIDLLGGKDLEHPSPHRQDGYLGDSTLMEISHDFQVPICYLADVLVGWGVPPPIDVNVWLGDMITGEQAFAILEAIHTLDVGALNDRYAEMDLQTTCLEYGIEVRDGFELAMKEGWNLPFGVRTFLRVEQEDYLIETLAPNDYEL